MQIQKRDIALSIVLTIFTCGLYNLYWMYKLTNEVHALSDKPRTPDGGTVVLYTVLTCYTYFYYWLYKIGGELIDLRRKNGLPPDSVSNKTYMIVTVIVSVLYVVVTMLNYTIQFLISATAGAAPRHAQLHDEKLAFGIIVLMVVVGFIIVAIVHSVIAGIVLWSVYKRKDDSPILVYMLMALLRTYGLTIGFLQHSLNDFLQRRDSGALQPSPSSETPAAGRISLQKPLSEEGAEQSGIS